MTQLIEDISFPISKVRSPETTESIRSKKCYKKNVWTQYLGTCECFSFQSIFFIGKIKSGCQFEIGTVFIWIYQRNKLSDVYPALGKSLLNQVKGT